MYLNEGKTYTKQEIKSSEMRNVNNKQDQGSKAPTGHSSFYPYLPFFQVYLSILSFAPST